MVDSPPRYALTVSLCGQRPHSAGAGNGWQIRSVKPYLRLLSGWLGHEFCLSPFWSSYANATQLFTVQKCKRGTGETIRIHCLGS